MKICIVGLISLFTWNALFGAFGGLLLCIHQDLDMHVDEDSVNGFSCSSDHSPVNVEVSCVDADESCVDIELLAEQLPPARLQSEAYYVAPLVLLAVLIDYLQVSEPSLAFVYQSAEPCAPSHVLWLTDDYLQTTVLRV
ncbi:hypothetical protein ACWPKS_17515 [Coraliomargarita sp. W4R72]